MNTILEQINLMGKAFVEFAVPMLVQSSVLILILLLLDLALRKKVKAVFRYCIWMLVLVKLILPTSLSSPLSLGYWFGDHLAYVAESRTAAAPEAEAEALEPALADMLHIIEPVPIEVERPVPAVLPMVPDVEPAVTEVVRPPAVPVTPVTWQGVVFLLWLAVVTALGLLLLQRAIFVRGLVAQAKEANRLMNDALEYCCKCMGVKRKIGLKVSANAAGPAVCGLFRPVILLPHKLAPSLGSRGLRAVLLHELAHIRRKDLWVNLAQTVLQIGYFYNPLLWLANAMIRRVREQAIDETVLVAMGEKAQQYPQTLVNVAKLAFKRPALSLRLIGVVESKSALAGRIKHILNRPMPKSAKVGIVGVLAVIIAGAILLPMAAGRQRDGWSDKDLLIKFTEQKPGEPKVIRSAGKTTWRKSYDVEFAPWEELLVVAELYQAGRPMRQLGQKVFSGSSGAQTFSVKFVRTYKNDAKTIVGHSGTVELGEEVLEIAEFTVNTQRYFGGEGWGGYHGDGLRRTKARYTKKEYAELKTLFYYHSTDGGGVDEGEANFWIPGHNVTPTGSHHCVVLKMIPLSRLKYLVCEPVGGWQGLDGKTIPIGFTADRAEAIADKYKQMIVDSVEQQWAAEKQADMRAGSLEHFIGKYAMARHPDTAAFEITKKGGVFIFSDLGGPKFEMEEAEDGLKFADGGGERFLLRYGASKNVYYLDNLGVPGKEWEPESILLTKISVEKPEDIFAATLPNGVTVELVGVCEHPSEGKQWCRADGSLLAEAPYERTNSYADPKDDNDFEFAFHFRGYPFDDINQAWKRIPEATDGSVAIGSALINEKRVPDFVTITTSFPKNQNTVTIPLGVAAGSWKSFAITDGRGERSTSAGDKVVRFEAAYQKEAKTYLMVWHNFYDAVARLIAIDTSGKPQIGNEVEGGIGKGVEGYKYAFEVPLKEITTFQLQTRPYQWATFKNVSLRPGMKTDVQVEGEGGQHFEQRFELGEDIPVQLKVGKVDDWIIVSAKTIRFEKDGDNIGVELTADVRKGFGMEWKTKVELLDVNNKVLDVRTVTKGNHGLSDPPVMSLRKLEFLPFQWDTIADAISFRVSFEQLSPIRDALGRELTSAPKELIQGRITDPKGQPVADAVVTIAEYKPGANSHRVPKVSTNQRGYYKLSQVDWPYHIVVQRLLPASSGLANRYQAIRLKKVLKGPQTVDLQFDEFPKGSASLECHIVDKYGKAVEKFHFMVLDDIDWEAIDYNDPAAGYIRTKVYRMDVDNTEGRFTVEDLPIGNYKIWIIPKDKRYEDTTEKILIEEGANVKKIVEVLSSYVLYGRVLFEDGSPAVVKPTPWPGAKTSIIKWDAGLSFGAGIGEVDDDGYFQVYLSQKELEQVEEGKSRLSITIPTHEEGHRKTMGTFPFDLLAENRNKAGVIRVKRPEDQKPTKPDVQVESKTDSLDQLGDAPEEVRAIGKVLKEWFESCAAGDLEKVKKAYLPSKSNNAKHDLQRMKQLLEVVPDWRFSLLTVIWDAHKAKAVSHKISHPGADSPLVFVWQLKKFEGQWRIADQFGGGQLNEFGNLEEFLNYLDRYVFCQEYPTGYMWLDTADPNLRLRTNSRKSEAGPFAKSHWPQLDGAPEQVQQIAKVLKRWFAACLAEDAEQVKELYHPNTQRHAEDKLEDMNRILAMAPDWWFSPMMIKFSKSEADAISHPMEKINFPGASDPMISIVRFKKIEGQWTILSSSMDGLRSLPDSYAYFYRRYPDGQIWFDKSIPDWLKPDQQTGVDVDIEELKGISEKVKPDYSLAEKIRAINGEKEIFESYFPDSIEGGKALEKWWPVRDKDPDIDKKIFSMVRNGLRRDSQGKERKYRNKYIKWVGNKYIWRAKSQNQDAIELMYYATFDSQLASDAVYYGLSVVRGKRSDKILKRFVELCMANVSVSRILWGTKGQHEDMLLSLEPYLKSGDLQIKDRASVLEKVFKGEIDYGQWEKEQRRQKRQAEFGEKLPEIREVLLRGNSHQRRELFDLIRRKGLKILFDESFVEPLKACLKDGAPSVREAAIEYGGDLFGKRGECSDEMLEIMDSLSKDWDSKVREAVAVFVGSHWIWGVEPQNPKAIEIMMELSKDKDRGVRNQAVYYGLSVVENKSDKVIKRLIEMALDAGASSDLGRIGWGLGIGADKEKIKMYLMPYLEPGNRKGERARQLYREMFKAEPPNSPKEATKDKGLVVKTSALQSLIDSARPGDTVIVPEGVYTEPIEITKSLTLKGQSRAACVFEVTADKPAIFIDTKGKGRVTIEAVTIKWQLATSDKSEYYFAVGVKDSKAEVKNCNFVPLGNFKRSPVAIHAIGFSNLTINTCRFEGFEYTVCYGEGTEGTIQDSLVMGSGHQGISLYSGATVKIIRNVVTGSKYHGVRSTGGTLDMKDNLIIENANRGVYLGNKSAHGTITNNIITGNRLVGISGFAQSDVKIYNNLILNSGQVGIGAQPSCRFLLKDNIIKGNPSGIVVFLKEGARRGNLLIRRNTFWNNETDTENCEKAPLSISEEPAFRDPANGDFSLTGGKVMEQKQGLTDPKVFKALWKRWKNRADKTDVSVEVEGLEVGPAPIVRAVDNKAMLAGGLTVELLGLTEIPIKDNPWWKPNGSLIEQPPFDNVSFDPSRDPNHDQFAYYAVAMKLKGKAPDEIRLIKWNFTDALYAGTTSAYLDDKGVYKQNIRAAVAKLPKDVETTALRLGFAGGDWQTLVAGRHYGFYRKGEDSIVVRTPERAGEPFGVRPQEKGLHISVTYNITDRDFRVVAVDKDGKIHISTRSGSSGTGNLRRTTASFPDLTRDELQEYRFQVRGYEWVEFRNIALRPGKEAVALAEQRRAGRQKELEKWLGRGRTRRIREQILVLRGCRIFKEMEAWALAIRELVSIGKPAVPELLAELRRAQRWPTQSTVAFTLRAIGDRRAVPVLIEVLGRVEYRGEYGIHLKDPPLSVFMLENQHRPAPDRGRKQKDPQITIGCPVIEITAALEKITGHTEGHEHYGHKAVAELGSDAPRDVINRRIQEIVREVAGRWQKWWQQNKQKTDVSVDVEVEAALGWLKLVDDGDYAKSFDKMAALFRGGVRKADWEKTMDLYGKGFGKAVSRKVSSKRHTRHLATGPAGEYVIIEFESSFEYKSKAAETVTLMRDRDGVWRVTDYFIK